MSGIGGIAERTGRQEGLADVEALNRQFTRDRAMLDRVESNPNYSQKTKEKARFKFFDSVMKKMKDAGEDYEGSPLAFVMAILGINWIHDELHHAKEIFIKSKLEVLKLEMDVIKAEYLKEELWMAQVEKTHDLQNRRAFFGYTKGAVKEISTLSNHAFFLDELEIHCRFDKKEIVSGIVAGDHGKALTMRDMALAYNAHFKDEGGKNGYAELVKRFEAGEIPETEFQKYGFSYRWSREIKLDPDKENLTMPELASLGIWLFSQRKDKDTEAYRVDKKARSYIDPRTGQAFAFDIADSDRYRDEWKVALGFDKHDDLVYGDRDLWQKWIMFQLKTPSQLQEGLRHRYGEKPDDRWETDALYGTNALKFYQHDSDYYHRGLSKAVGGQIGRYQMRSREQTEQRLGDLQEMVELRRKDGRRTPEENTRLEFLKNRNRQLLLEEQVDQAVLGDVVNIYVEDKIKKAGWDPQDKQDIRKIEAYRNWVAGRIQRRWAMAKNERGVDRDAVKLFTNRMDWTDEDDERVTDMDMNLTEDEETLDDSVADWLEQWDDDYNED